MPNMENYFLYEDYQYQLVSHVLILGVGAMIAGLVYFILTSQSLMPKYRIASYLGCVVMVSAGLILWTQFKSWDETFIYVDDGNRAGWVNQASTFRPASRDPGSMQSVVAENEPKGRLFNNDFRYMNWSIDVPTLQVQLLAVIGLAGASFVRIAVRFTAAGLAIIYFSYIAQFFEYAFAPRVDDGGAITWFWLFYALGWVAYVYILYAVYTSVFQQTDHMHPRAQKVMRGIWILFLVSWTVYGIAVAIPAFAFNVHGAIWRQFLFSGMKNRKSTNRSPQPNANELPALTI